MSNSTRKKHGRGFACSLHVKILRWLFILLLQNPLVQVFLRGYSVVVILLNILNDKSASILLLEAYTSLGLKGICDLLG
ncbi:hypothetical protein [Helicobacter suis]|uniref:hypothetical protein n=1 Tax=Helicobacter suis TaxID=104628 RepID=UPI0002DF4F89|nr:hypothetical protein [Helicobacter suis]